MTAKHWIAAAGLAAILCLAHVEPASADQVSGKVTLNNENQANAVLDFRRASGQGGPTVRVHADANGDYRVFLAPGNFVVSLIPSSGEPPGTIDVVSYPAPVTQDLPFRR